MYFGMGYGERLSDVIESAALSAAPRIVVNCREDSSVVDLHIHSTYSDGVDPPEALVEAAVQVGLKHICIADHVNACVPWLPDFVSHIRRLADQYRDQIEVLCGIETKILDLGGTLDAGPDFYDQVDLVFGAVHDIPTDEGLAAAREDKLSHAQLLKFWEEAFHGLLENPHVHIIAHPTAVLDTYGLNLSRTSKIRIARLARRYGKALERNSKYNVPDKEFLDILVRRKVRLVRGTDSHSVDELVRMNGGNRST